MGRARKIANSITTAMFSAFRTANQALTSGCGSTPACRPCISALALKDTQLNNYI